MGVIEFDNSVQWLRKGEISTDLFPYSVLYNVHAHTYTFSHKNNQLWPCCIVCCKLKFMCRWFCVWGEFASNTDNTLAHMYMHRGTGTGTPRKRSISNIIMMQIKVFLCIKLFTWIEMLNEQEPMRISSFSSALQAESVRAYVHRTYVWVCFMWEAIDGGDRIGFKNRFIHEILFSTWLCYAKVNQSSSTYHLNGTQMEVVWVVCMCVALLPLFAISSTKINKQNSSFERFVRINTCFECVNIYMYFYLWLDGSYHHIGEPSYSLRNIFFGIFSTLISERLTSSTRYIWLASNEFFLFKNATKNIIVQFN